MESLFRQRDGAVFNDLLARDGWPVSAAMCSGVTFGVSWRLSIIFREMQIVFFRSDKKWV